MGSWRRRAHASIQLRWLAMMTHGPFGSRSRPATFQSNASRMSDPTVARRNRNAGVARGVTGRTPARGRLAEAVDDIVGTLYSGSGRRAALSETLEHASNRAGLNSWGRL